jgi:hypothetical protein
MMIMDIQMILPVDEKAPILATKGQVRLLKEDGVIKKEVTKEGTFWVSQMTKDYLMGKIDGFKNDSRLNWWD